MKIIAIGAVTAGGKTTVVRELSKKLKKAKSLHFDDYSFEGEVDDFNEWTKQGADYNVRDLSPLKKDIIDIIQSGQYDYLLLDYPFAYCHKEISEYIDCAVFIDTPLDVAMARRILRDMQNADGNEIRAGVENYIKYERVSYLQMLKDILPSSDYVLDGTNDVSELVDEILKLILSADS